MGIGLSGEGEAPAEPNDNKGSPGGSPSPEIS